MSLPNPIAHSPIHTGDILTDAKYNGDFQNIIDSVNAFYGSATPKTVTPAFFPALLDADLISLGPVWTNTTATWWYFFFTIPPDYTGGNVVLSLYVRQGNAAGTFGLIYQTRRWRNGAAGFSGPDDVVYLTYGDTTTHIVSFVAAAANLAIGDSIRWAIGRNPSDVGDTLNEWVGMDGAGVIYSGYRAFA